MGPRGLADVGRMTFEAKAFIAEQTEAIRKQVPGKAIIACSGGVDSTTAAVLASRALGDRLLAVYVDTGLMRKDETEDVARTLKELKVNHRILRAADEFFAALPGIVDPEKKRVIIGNKFVELFEREAKTFGADHLVQGTIAPDWIESGGQLRDRIKTHHNVAGLPPNMKLKLVEPLRDLYKDEVRSVARALAVRAVDSIDGMSAVYSKIPHEVLDRISTRITNEVPGINRVVFDVSNKPPATIEWE